MFLKKFGDNKGLTPKQAKQINDARVMLGEAYYRSGEYEQAYEVLKKLSTAMDAADPRYWSVKSYLAESAQRLGSKSEDYVEEALSILLELQGLLKEHTEDWGDVTADIAEVRNTLGRYDDNLLVIRRTVATWKGLDRAIRARYAAVLEKIYNDAEDDEDRDDALGLLVEVKVAELNQLAREKRYHDMFRVISDFRVIAIDYGGAENRKKFHAIVKNIGKTAKDPQTIKEAEKLAEELKD